MLNVTVITFNDIVESVILLKDEACGIKKNINVYITSDLNNINKDEACGIKKNINVYI